MYNGGKILIGIIVFLLFAAFPFYNNIGKVSAKPEPKLDTPVIQQLAEKKCVEPKEFMKAEHMQMLNDWRDAAIREGKRIYVNSEGKIFNISLQNTCMNCHSNKKEFCDKCHAYAAVKPYCWTCHIEPKEKRS
ncbi:MAG: sulfate reduction electron transfer complex DsrMKJOP subunit DsrJ [Nitrospirae bacterium]|nr:sulfate reduction electron transfer complex DsrMKJOP subunit DsrJ [Nitrospirota bacterium]